MILISVGFITIYGRSGRTLSLLPPWLVANETGRLFRTRPLKLISFGRKIHPIFSFMNDNVSFSLP